MSTEPGTMRIHFCQHVSFEGPEFIATWAGGAGHRLTATHTYRGEPFPSAPEIDWLVVMGGPMSVRDEAAYPWLRPEKELIRSAIVAQKIVLGICLGAQLIADCLGAKVYPNPAKEIGWFPVERTPAASRSAIGQVLPARFEAFHWHGETFELPAGAVHLARSEACVAQAFAYGERVLALQCHLEVTRAGIAQLCRHGAADLLKPGPFVQSAEAMLNPGERFERSNQLMAAVLGRLADA